VDTEISYMYTCFGGRQITKTRRTYTDEFKREAVRLLDSSGKTARQLEQELGIGKTCLSRWKRELEENGEQAFPGQGHVPRSRNRFRN
jgi:transposase